jgi:hypothetical protein
MNKLKKYRAKSTRDDFSTIERHIDFLHIYAFATEGVDFTEEETAHFDVCRRCRLRVVDTLRNAEPHGAGTITPKAAA